jgi:hypothetical protein
MTFSCHPERSEGPFLSREGSFGLRPRDDSGFGSALPLILLSSGEESERGRAA